MILIAEEVDQIYQAENLKVIVQVEDHQVLVAGVKYLVEALQEAQVGVLQEIIVDIK